mgnify:CR=1 FL=1
MIIAYHRPQTLDEALTLLIQPNTVPLGGGTFLSRKTTNSVQAVDLQALGLDFLTKKGNDLEIGATCTLQSLFENENCPEALKAAIKLEAPINIRNSATVAGTLVASDGRSPFATVLLSLDAKITIVSKQSSIIGVSEFLLLRPRGLITTITIPLNVNFTFEFVSRTPADKPIICAALTQWSSGRTRLALGGYGKTPMVAMDGTEADGLESAARNAYHEATDEWASAEYRMNVASVLAKRCLETL